MVHKKRGYILQKGIIKVSEIRIKGIKRHHKYCMRELCERCNTNPRAINYKKDGRTFYRRFCDACIIEKKKIIKPKWQQDGYKKKHKCESCGYVSKFSEQVDVIDYNKTYRTICLNCKVIFDKEKRITIKGDLKSDF